MSKVVKYSGIKACVSILDGQNCAFYKDSREEMCIICNRILVIFLGTKRNFISKFSESKSNTKVEEFSVSKIHE